MQNHYAAQPTYIGLHETRAIAAIAERAWGYLSDVYRHKLELCIDIEQAHKACPLDLDRMSVGPIGDLVHDVAGIYRHLNRGTGELENCFVPRYAKRQ